MSLAKGLRRFAAAGRILLEVRGLRQEVQALRAGVDRIADALEQYNAHQWPQVRQADPTAPAVEVTYADQPQQQEFMDIELRLTAARGQPPTEDEILAEYERRHPIDQVAEG